MCFRITRCCCFTNTKDGSFAIGIYTSILNLISITVTTVVLILNQFANDLGYGKFNENAIPGLNEHTVNKIPIVYLLVNDNAISIIPIVSLVFGIVGLIISFLLIYAAKNDYRLFLIPWLAWMVITITAEIVLFILLLIATFYIGFIVIGVVIVQLSITFDIYCYSCVYSHFKILNEVRLPHSLSKEYLGFK